MKTLRSEVKEEIRRIVEDYVSSPMPNEAKVALIQLWVVGLMENADTHEKVFFNESPPA